MKTTLRITFTTLLLVSLLVGCNKSQSNPINNPDVEETPSTYPILPLDSWIEESVFDTLQFVRSIYEDDPLIDFPFSVTRESCAKESGLICMTLNFSTNTLVINKSGFYPYYYISCYIPYSEDEKLVAGVYSNRIDSISPYAIRRVSIWGHSPNIPSSNTGDICMQILEVAAQTYTIHIWMRHNDIGVNEYLCIENIREGEELGYSNSILGYYPCH